MSDCVRVVLSVMFVFVFVVSVSAEEEQAQPPEYRMAWVLTLEGKELSTPEGIKNVIEECRKANMNAVVPVIRRRGRAYYKSEIEPFYNPDPQNPLNFDPLEELIKAAHDTSGGKERIEVHAWIVVSPVWMEKKSPPPGHVSLLHPNWMTLNYDSDWSEETPQHWLDLGVPEVEDYLTDLCVELVDEYKIDGINLDYIRYREGGFGYNPIALKRFQHRYNRTDRPSPEDEQWNEWRREQVTNLVRRIFVETKKEDPDIKISVCSITWGALGEEYEKTRGYYDVAQDWPAWAKEGIFDINMPMIYKREFDEAQKQSYRDWVKFLVANRYDTLAVAGIGAYLNSITDTIAQVMAARQLGADGSIIFRLTVNNKDDEPWEKLLNELKKGVFVNPAPIPEIKPYNERSYGTFCGRLTYGTFPADGVSLTLRTDSKKTLQTVTSGTGYFAFANIPPGKYSLESAVHGELLKSLKVKEGRIKTEDIDLNEMKLSSFD